MTIMIEAIYENGSLRLHTPLPLPEHSHVTVTIESAPLAEADPERPAWLRASSEKLNSAWAAEDDVFNELLTK